MEVAVFRPSSMCSALIAVTLIPYSFKLAYSVSLFSFFSITFYLSRLIECFQDRLERWMRSTTMLFSTNESNSAKWKQEKCLIKMNKSGRFYSSWKFCCLFSFLWENRKNHQNHIARGEMLKNRVNEMQIRNSLAIGFLGEILCCFKTRTM